MDNTDIRRKRYSQYSCQKCQDISPGEPVKLCGQYLTTLCDPHRNEWHELIAANKDFREFRTTSAMIERAGHVGGMPDDQFTRLMLEKMELEETLYRIGKEWVIGDDEEANYRD